MSEDDQIKQEQEVLAQPASSEEEELWKKFAPKVNKAFDSRLARLEAQLKNTEATQTQKEPQTVDARTAEMNSLKEQIKQLVEENKKTMQEKIDAQKDKLLSKAFNDVGIAPTLHEISTAYIEKHLKYDVENKKWFYQKGEEVLTVEDAVSKFLPDEIKKVTPAKQIKQPFVPNKQSSTGQSNSKPFQWVKVNGSLVKKYN